MNTQFHVSQTHFWMDLVSLLNQIQIYRHFWLNLMDTVLSLLLFSIFTTRNDRHCSQSGKFFSSGGWVGGVIASLSVFVCWKQLLAAVGIKRLDMEQWGFSSAFSRICFVFLCSPTFISAFKQFPFSFCLLHQDKNNVNQLKKKVERKTKTEWEEKTMARRGIAGRFSGGLKVEIKAGQTGTLTVYIYWW